MEVRISNNLIYRSILTFVESCALILPHEIKKEKPSSPKCILTNLTTFLRKVFFHTFPPHHHFLSVSPLLSQTLCTHTYLYTAYTYINFGSHQENNWVFLKIQETEYVEGIHSIIETKWNFISTLNHRYLEWKTEFVSNVLTCRKFLLMASY